MKTINFRFLTLLIFWIAESTFTYGGGIGRIYGPVILPFVKHKVLVLEFESPQEKTWGGDISQIIAQEFLGSMEGVFNFGVVNLLQQNQRVEYTPENIKKIAEQQKGLIVIWGEFYYDSTDVYIHCHLRVIPQDKFPGSALGLTADAGGIKMAAKPPTLQVNFNPVRISIESLDRMRNHYLKAISLRAAPDENAKIKGELKVGNAYFIKKRKGDWIRIILSNGKSGWVKFSTLANQNELSSLKGVIKLGQGILQFIAGKFPVAVKSIGTYVNDFSSEEDSMNKSFSYLLLGNSILRAENYEYSIPAEERISQLYEDASNLLPDQASPVNHLAIIALMKGNENFSASILKYRDIEKKLVNVIKTENDIDAVNNLKALYQAERQNSFVRSSIQMLDKILVQLANVKNEEK